MISSDTESFNAGSGGCEVYYAENLMFDYAGFDYSGAPV